MATCGVALEADIVANARPCSKSPPQSLETESKGRSWSLLKLEATRRAFSPGYQPIPFSRELLFCLPRRLSLRIHRRSLSCCFIQSFLPVVIVFPSQRNTAPACPCFFLLRDRSGTKQSLSCLSAYQHIIVRIHSFCISFPVLIEPCHRSCCEKASGQHRVGKYSR